MYEYRVYDRRSGVEGEESVQPDMSAKSEMAAIRRSGIPAVYADIETRLMDPDELRPWVGGDTVPIWPR